MRKLTDRQRKEVIADYLDCGNYVTIAKAYGVNRSTIKRIVDANKVRMQEQYLKQEDVESADVATYMDSKAEVVCKLIDDYLAELIDRERLEGAPLNQIASAMGVVIDKFIKNGRTKNENGLVYGLIRGLREDRD